MRVSSSLLLFCLLGACATQAPTLKPHESGGSKADGIVTLSSTRLIYNPVEPDWHSSVKLADNRCHSWGHRGPAYFAGDQIACEVYDFHGRCARSTVTRFYSCSE